MKHLLLIVMLLSAVSASGQVVIYGHVRAIGTAEGVADANIMLQDVEGKALYDYCISDSDGNYSLEYSGKEKALRVVVTGFNIKPQSREIEGGAQRVDFEVEYSDLEIKEVVVRAASVERHSDTITYNVATFINASDRSISVIGDGAHSAINLLKQSANVDFIIAERVICRVGAEHFLNSAISGKSRNTIFIDASIRVKHKRMEYAIEAHNILNNTSFANASNSNSMSHIYSYSLRPASVVFRVKFSLK